MQGAVIIPGSRYSDKPDTLLFYVCLKFSTGPFQIIQGLEGFGLYPCLLEKLPVVKPRPDVKDPGDCIVAVLAQYPGALEGRVHVFSLKRLYNFGNLFQYATLCKSCSPGRAYLNNINPLLHGIIKDPAEGIFVPTDKQHPDYQVSTPGIEHPLPQESLSELLDTLQNPPVLHQHKHRPLLILSYIYACIRIPCRKIRKIFR
ncbi:hypothetical protein BMS3Bbin07_00199 [bacterium BMS3Bbin07]|nr:hypothetical protein BMS3Bbin07_00199 [bacterium BMS3Bbin07]